jgi:three-Cys-motif partner protein
MTQPAGLIDDGLPTPEVGSWSLQKYRLLDLYNTLFSTGMKNQWDLRVYIDLFSGPGRAQIRKTQRIVETSPLIALRVPDPFDKYIFCDKEAGNIAALQERVQRDFPGADAAYISGDCNDLVEEVARNIPKASKNKTVLSFCFVDPFGIGDIRFDTIHALGSFRLDFLILLALDMDANRFRSLYVQTANPAIDEFLGDPSWRTKWDRANSRRVDFRVFLAQEFARRMVDLGYLPAGLDRMKEVRSDEKNLPLYHLAFFSKHPRGYQFWDQVLKYGTDQLSLSFV